MLQRAAGAVVAREGVGGEDVGGKGRSFEQGVGKTPLLRLRSLDEVVGARLLGKAEFLSVGGSVKDRAAAFMVLGAEQDGRLPRGGGGVVVEATGGNTGVSLVLAAHARGHKTVMAVPSGISKGKIDLMRAFGAEVVECDGKLGEDDYFVAVAEKIAKKREGAVLMDQFNNPLNPMAHVLTTGPEVWEQSGGDVDALVLAGGSGGTLLGLGTYLREKSGGKTKVVLAEGPGSKLAGMVMHGEVGEVGMEGGGVSDGIGKGDWTGVWRSVAKLHLVDHVHHVNNHHTTAMMAYLAKQEGICVGPSAALNVVAAVREAKRLAKEQQSNSKQSTPPSPPSTPTVVTILCDSGERYMGAAWNKQWREERGVEDAFQFGMLASPQQIVDFVTDV